MTLDLPQYLLISSFLANLVLQQEYMYYTKKTNLDSWQGSTDIYHLCKNWLFAPFIMSTYKYMYLFGKKMSNLCMYVAGR